jgi:glyoxylase-like metal-dependent hydrolase (beta-lactamase superfamily II)
MRVDRIADGLHAWASLHPKWGRPGGWSGEVVSFAVVEPGRTLLVDPLVPDGGWEAVDAVVAGDTEIVVTVPYHVRSAAAASARYGRAPVWGHAACRPRLPRGVPFRELSPISAPAGVSAYAIGSPPRHETPVRIASQRALVFGDAVVGTPEGDLRVWADAYEPGSRRERWYRGRFLPTLEPLARLDVDRVLVTHGPSVLRHGRRALREAFDRPPWPGP